MTYNEERLANAETTLKLAVRGFNEIAKELVANVGEDFAETIAPYVKAVEELKSSVEYYRKDVEKEKAKENA